NTASSFVTNTNWQYYGGETTLSYFASMAGLTVQNFVSAAVGMAALVALVRGIVGRNGQGLGNFWQDTVRGLYYILLPLSIIVSIARYRTAKVTRATTTATRSAGTPPPPGKMF